MLKRDLTLGVIAGLCIGIGGSVFLACCNDYAGYGKIVGAIMFSVALLCICFRGYALFTGKVGFLVISHKKADFSAVLLSLLGNLIGTAVSGYAIRYALPALGEKALAICEPKLAQTVPETIIRAIFCGILMYLAVVIYRENKSIAGIFFCVPVFILAGFEHSIANMFYFAASGIVSLNAFAYLWIVILGNAIGGMLIPALSLLCKEKNTAN
ncbi:MAG: formate/nitrite transporter family protein [Ruminococcaceae bacterium]|nr:formate/nitrite transporter family protein [Oscillospiraceae bacterium]